MERYIEEAPDFERAERMTRSVGTGLMVAAEDRSFAFAAAGRRTRRVRFLRRAVLVGVVVTIASMIGIWIFNPFSTRFGNLSFSALSVDGTKVAIAKPRLSGFRSDGQPYSLTAERAVQDVKQPTRVELHQVTGEVGVTAGETTHIRADTGSYDSSTEQMRLENNIKIDNGRFDVRLRSADIDFRNGVYTSNEPVEVKVGSGTTIHGDRAQARNNGQELVFEGRVRTTIVTQAEDAAAR